MISLNAANRCARYLCQELPVRVPVPVRVRVCVGPSPCTGLQGQPEVRDGVAPQVSPGLVLLQLQGCVRAFHSSLQTSRPPHLPSQPLARLSFAPLELQG